MNMKAKYMAMTPRELVQQFLEMTHKINNDAFAAGMKLESRLKSEIRDGMIRKTLTLAKDASMPNSAVVDLVMGQTRNISITIEAPEFHENKGEEELREASQVTYTALRLMEVVADFMGSVMMSMLEGRCTDHPELIDQIEALDPEFGKAIREAIKKDQDQEQEARSPLDELLGLIKDIADVETGLRAEPGVDHPTVMRGFVSKKMN